MTASSRSRSALLLAFALGTTLAGGGCTQAGSGDGGTDDAPLYDPTSCPIDPDTSAAKAETLPLASGSGSAMGYICPRGHSHWYAVDFPPGADLLDLTAGYPDSATRVSIAVTLFASDGTMPLAGLADSRTGAHRGTISTTLRVPGAGHYFLQVHDVGDSESDSLNSYVVQLATATDPDTHEPNDTLAQAKLPDGKPGWLAYQGDHDAYKVSVPAGSSLLDVKLTNPAASKTVLHYALETAAGDGGANVLGEGDAPPSDTPLDVVRLLPGAPAAAGGDFYVVISAPTGAAPDRTPAVGYTLALTPMPELDPNDQGARNDSGASATCLTGPGPDPKAGCAGSWMGGSATWTGAGQVGSLGDRDFFRFDVAGQVPAIVEWTAQVGLTGMQLAADLLVPEPGSPCKSDSDCAAVKIACSKDSDCEVSHSCLPASTYPQCAGGQSCRLCAGAGACVPVGKPGGATVCAMPQMLLHEPNPMGKPHAAQVKTAQPLLLPGPYYLVVHAFGDSAYDYGNPYTLSLTVSPEPDPLDQSAVPSQRNNFYNPHPMQMDDLQPSQSRAKDVTADLMAGRPITGYISYASDEDWFSFKHPCPNMDCGLVFEWTQPGPSPMRLAVLMRKDDQSLHESWTYEGVVPTGSLPGPVTLSFGDGDCHQCSFASSTYNGSRYFLQLRAVGSNSWDSSMAGLYSVRLRQVTPGCPANCGEYGTPMKPVCNCWCKAEARCPPGPQL